MKCPHCDKPIQVYRNPVPTVDIIIEVEGRIVLIERKNPPFGWALPGGFVDYGESFETAALREAKEETGLSVFNLHQFHTYSDPGRDERQHTPQRCLLPALKENPLPAMTRKRQHSLHGKICRTWHLTTDRFLRIIFHQKTVFNSQKIKKPVPTDPYRVSQGIQSDPYFFTTTAKTASAAIPATTIIRPLLIAIYPRIRNPGLFRRRIDSGVTSTSSSSLI
jgi:ADP-ribose pyrophosphatase YjhB (NUDIX family)